MKITFTTLSTAVKAHGEWIKPVSVHAACHSTHSGKLIDGNTDTTWHHWTKEVHWITLDMGSSYPIDTIRLYHKQWALSADNDQISNWIEYKLGTNPIADEGLQLGTHYQYDPLGRAKKIERIPSQ